MGTLYIERGVCTVMFAYDVALSINLDTAERYFSTTSQRESIKHTHPAPSYFEFRPAPVRVTQEAQALLFGEYRSLPTVNLVLYDFGAVSVIYSIPLRGPLSALLPLSEALYGNSLLLADSRQHVQRLMTAIAPALARPDLSDLVEDYVIYQISECSTPCSPATLYGTYGSEIAGILRAEREALSDQEVTDVLSHRISYGTNDVTIIDWNASLLYDRDGEDVRAVLEFANVELLEMRYLDQHLDDALDRSYETLLRPTRGPFALLRSRSADFRDVAQLQVENAILFEGVNNALKLLGDQYLARVYRVVSQRFRLAEWDTSILRKLQTLESIYEKMVDRTTTTRMELLEWIIIILIAISIVLPFLPGVPGH